MKNLKDKFNTNISIYTLIYTILLGIFISITINQIFIILNIIDIKIVNKDIYYYIAIVLRIITSVIIGPLIEEIFFRGIIFTNLNKKLNIILSAIITTIFFSLLHVSLSGIVFSLILGVILIYFYIKTKNLFIPYIIHASSNLMALFISNIPVNMIIFSISLLISTILFFICNKKCFKF